MTCSADAEGFEIRRGETGWKKIRIVPKPGENFTSPRAILGCQEQLDL